MKSRVFCLISLLAVVAALCVGCGEDVPEVVWASDFKLKFKDDGNLVIKNFKPASMERFNKIVLGHGWVEKETHEVLPDGSISKADYWLNMLGGGPETYEFSEGSVTNFFETDAYMGVRGFSVRQSMSYDETNGNLDIDGDTKFIVLSVGNDVIHAIKKGGVSYSEDGSQERIFLYVKLARLSDDEFKEMKSEYWAEFDAINSPMVLEELCRKWVPWDGVSEVTDGLRSNDSRYIRFHADGTFDGKYDNSSFAGTFEYEPDTYVSGSMYHTGSIKISSDGVLPGDFLLLIRAHHFELLGSSMLTIKVDGYQTDWYFVNGKDE